MILVVSAFDSSKILAEHSIRPSDLFRLNARLGSFIHSYIHTFMDAILPFDGHESVVLLRTCEYGSSTARSESVGPSDQGTGNKTGRKNISDTYSNSFNFIR
mmetsp:Transcript_15928/g.36745  ORF Transcript_15928/g.36745 Transcript_15928/m.36745 type:complete len:102 (-) Transcript_15928:79-384(-)